MTTLRPLRIASDGNLHQPNVLARDDILALAHDPDYVKARFHDATLGHQETGRMGLPWKRSLVTPHHPRRGGLRCLTAELALKHGWPAILAVGTHLPN